MVPSRRGAGLAALGDLVLVTAVLCVLAPRIGLARDVPFAPQSVISTDTSEVYSVFATDVDGDGDTDVLSSSAADNKISWYENDGASPPAWTARTISSNALTATSVFAADVDGDGDIDVLSSSLSDDTIAWYENDGALPPAWTARTISTAADNPYWVSAADVDGDGDIDALSASGLDDKVAWYENDGASPPTWTARTISTALDFPWVIFAADVDGDGDIDVLSASANDDTIAWHENDGASPPGWTLRTISTTALTPYFVFAADVDRDGDMDVLSASFDDHTIAWYENSGASPPAWTPHTISTTLLDPTSVFAADLDGDGDTDVLATSFGDGRIVWYENLGGSPATWGVHPIATVGASVWNVAAADLDGDGDLDAMYGSEAVDNTAWYENKTIHRAAQFLEQRVISTAPDFAVQVSAADVDGDGDIDALSASELDDTIAWYSNLDGAGTFGSNQTITNSANGARSVVAADVDGDGDMDALSASAEDDKIAWYENLSGSGATWSPHVISTTADTAIKVFAADVDGDGDTDALSISNSGGKVAWHENVNPAGIWDEHVISMSAAGGEDVFAADVDGDGDIDVLSASGVDDKVAWYENVGGGGTAWTTHAISLTHDLPLSVFAADIDGDGDMDVVSASFLDQQVTWYENLSGAGTSWQAHLIGTAASGAWTAKAADMDNDGDLDVVAVLYPDHEVVWYQNGDGLGAFLPASLIAPSLYLFSVTTADVDGDGDLDPLTASGTDLIAWYPNSGGQVALDTTDLTPASVTPGVVFPCLEIEVKHHGRAGDSSLELSTLELLFEQHPGDPLTSVEANSLIDNLYVYFDADGNGSLGGGDVLVATVPNLLLSFGRLTVTLPDNHPALQVVATGSRNYIVAMQLKPGAANLPVNDFRVTHVTESSSTAEDSSSDIRLILQQVPNFTSRVVGLPPFVTAVTPLNNTLNVPVGTNVTVVFSEPVHPSTVNSTSFRLIDPFAVQVTASVGLTTDGRTATLDPVPPGGSLAFNTVYTVEVTGVEDLQGHANVPFTNHFATAAAPITGTPLPAVADQSVLPTPPPLGPGLSSADALLSGPFGPNLGYSVSGAGDLNHDNLADFVGGAPGYSLSGLPEAGAVAIYMGSDAPDPPTGNNPREVAEIIYTGQAAHERAGSSVAAGFDFNGDGTGDILIGAEQIDRTATPPGIVGPGKAYLIYFKPQEYDFNANGTPDYMERSEVFVPLSLVGAGISGVVFNGVAAGDQAGYAVAGGGLLESNDAKDDIVIGAPGSADDDGKVYVLFSSTPLSGTKSLGNVGTTIPGTVYVGSLGERLGASVALPGDVTAPVGPDIAMGAPLTDTTQIDAGRVYIAGAGNLVNGAVNASSIATRLDGDQACEQIGFAVAGGGDNRASGTPQIAGGDFDLLIGAPYFDGVASPGNPCLDNTPLPNVGRVVQTTGRLANATIGATQVGSSVEGVIWRGVQAGGGLGWAVGRLGDLSGNTLDDIGLSGPFVNPGTNGAGAVYVVEGAATGGMLGSINADQVGQIVSGGIFLGTQSGESAGLALCAAGDLDGDGLTGSPTAADFTVGSPGWDASLGTVHQVLGTLLQQPGECTALGCTVADLSTGAVLTVPPGALASGIRYRFAVAGQASLPTACGSHSVSGKSLVGSSSNTRTDCGTPPCTPPGFAIGPNVEVPTQPSIEYQLTQGEALALRYCDATLGWRTPSSGPITGSVKNNSYVPGRKAAASNGVDSLRLYGVFFDDADHDDVRDTCDCSPGSATIWSAPGPAGDLTLSGQGASPTTLTWGPPDCPGGAAGSLLYDTIRSTNKADFVNGAVCVEANGSDTTSTDAQNPPLGQGFYYIVSPENGCAAGSACALPSCVQTPARDC